MRCSHRRRYWHRPPLQMALSGSATSSYVRMHRDLSCALAFASTSHCTPHLAFGIVP